jgi:tight adherence protein C
MPQLIGLGVLVAALPLLWLALRTDAPKGADPADRPEADDHDTVPGRGGRDRARPAADQPAWVTAAAEGRIVNPVDLHDVMLQMRTIPRLVRPVLERFGKAVQRVTPGGIGASLERSIYLCGLQGRVSVTTLLAAKAISAAVGVAAAAYTFTTFNGIFRFLLTGGLLFIGWSLVNIIMNGRGKERQTSIQRKLPDVLDQMSVCVEAGLGFDAAMLRAAKSAGGPLGEELGRTIQDIRLGASRSQALNSLVQRSSVPEVRLFARALMQAEKTGIPVAKVLRIQAEDARERRRQLAEESAMKLPVKMLGPLMLCILPALFIVILGPAIMSIATSGLGST